MGYYSQIHLAWQEHRGSGGRASLAEFGQSCEINDAIRGYRDEVIAVRDGKQFIQSARSDAERATWIAFTERHQAELDRLEQELGLTNA